MNLNKSINTTIAVCAIFSMSACSTLYEPVPSKTKLDDQTVLSNTASVKNTYILKRDSTFTFCAEPSPDAAFSQALEMNLNFNLLSSNESGEEQEGSTELEMAGRTPSVMLARELLYRLCEFSKNHEIDTQTAVDLYRANLNIISNVANTLAGKSSVAVSENLQIQQTQKSVDIPSPPPPPANVQPVGLNSDPAVNNAPYGADDTTGTSGANISDDPFATDGDEFSEQTNGFTDGNEGTTSDEDASFMNDNTGMDVSSDDMNNTDDSSDTETVPGGNATDNNQNS